VSGGEAMRGRPAGREGAARTPSRNPLKSEDAAFRMLLWVAGVALVVIAIALLVQAL
jgi:hypothetical protein